MQKEQNTNLEKEATNCVYVRVQPVFRQRWSPKKNSFHLPQNHPRHDTKPNISLYKKGWTASYRKLNSAKKRMKCEASDCSWNPNPISTVQKALNKTQKQLPRPLCTRTRTRHSKTSGFPADNDNATTENTGTRQPFAMMDTKIHCTQYIHNTHLYTHTIHHPCLNNIE